jgi:hypothetical protein
MPAGRGNDKPGAVIFGLRRPLNDVPVVNA